MLEDLANRTLSLARADEPVKRGLPGGPRL
jgi:hypothetical protein